MCTKSFLCRRKGSWTWRTLFTCQSFAHLKGNAASQQDYQAHEVSQPPGANQDRVLLISAVGSFRLVQFHSHAELITNQSSCVSVQTKLQNEPH